MAVVLGHFGDDDGPLCSQSTHARRAVTSREALREFHPPPPPPPRSSAPSLSHQPPALQVALAGPVALHVITQLASSLVGQLRMMAGQPAASPVAA